MKKLFIISAIAISGLIFNTADAQMRLHFGFRFRPRVVVYTPAPVVVDQAPVYDQPQPVYNDSNDDYYYLPDVDAYYDVNDQCYYYYDGNDWISAAYLPGAYRKYDWRNAPRYEIRASRPYLQDDVYRSRYNGHAVGVWSQNNYNNHSNGGYSARQRDGFGQPSQSYRNRGGDDHFGNRGQGGYNQQSNRNDNHSRDTRGGSEHFVQNGAQGGYASHRMTKF